MLLARKGYEVLLVDRATFPSDIPHGHFIHRQGPQRLAQWGLLDRIARTRCPLVESVISDYGDGPLEIQGLTVDGIPIGCAPRRWALDEVLVNAAADAGAEVRTGYSVQAYVGDGQRITGITGRAVGGSASGTDLARITVGADGRNSKLAATVRARAYDTSPPLTCWYFSYWGDVPATGLELYLRGESMIFAFPTNDGMTAVFVAWAAHHFPHVRQDVESNFLAVVNRVPALAERLRAGRREERFFGASDLPNFLRQPYGPGWALVGDAGCHKDPFLALGICDALRDAELLAEGLDEGLSGRRPMDLALADYERRRNEATLADYRLNLQLARFLPLPPEALLIRRAVRGDAEATKQYFLMHEGFLSRERFMQSERIQELVARASADAA
jgi:flavin-dependent dehydrogenase